MRASITETVLPIPVAGRQKVWGAALMLTSALFFAVLGLFIKILGPGYRVWDIAFYRFVGGVIILVVLFGRSANLFRPYNPKLMLIRGVLGSLAFLSVVIAIRRIPLSTAMVLFYSFPAFASLFSPLLFKERITVAEICCTLAALGGVAIILDFKLEGTLPGQIMAVVAAILAGLTISIIKKLRENHGSVIIYFYFCLIGACISLGPFLTAPRMPRGGSEWLIIGGILFTSISGQLLMTHGFRYCKSWEGGLFMTSEVIFIAIIGIMFLNETVGGRFYIGSLLIIFSAISINLINRRTYHVQQRQLKHSHNAEK